MDVKRLRKQMRQQRQALSLEQQQAAAQQLCAQLTALSSVQAAQRIALYLVNDGEIDPSVFVQWALKRGVDCYLPVIGESKGSRSMDAPMRFAVFHADSEFINNRFGIPEPVVADSDLLEAAQLDLMLMPLVAFDDRGNRIGMGGGFYDRTLAFKAQQTYHQPPVLIGLAHAFQQLDQILPAAWDVPLDGIASDQNAWLFAR